MDLTSISSLSKLSSNGLTNGKTSTTGTNVEAFQNILQSAMDMVNETNNLTKDAEEAALNFAMGNATSTHELTIAQQKALTSLQYTVAVRDAVMEAYKEIMQLQF